MLKKSSIFLVLSTGLFLYGTAWAGQSLEDVWSSGFKLDTLASGSVWAKIEKPPEEVVLEKIVRLDADAAKIEKHFRAFHETADEASAMVDEILAAEDPAALAKSEELLNFLIFALPKENERVKNLILGIAFIELRIDPPAPESVLTALGDLKTRLEPLVESSEALHAKAWLLREKVAESEAALSGRVLWLTDQFEEDAAAIDRDVSRLPETTQEVIDKLSPSEE